MPRVRCSRFPRLLARSAFRRVTSASSLKVGVQAERHLAQQEVAEGIQAVLVPQFQRREDPAPALGHLGLVHQPVAVHVEVLVDRDARGLEHGGPVDAVGLQDVLGDEVLRHRPEGPEQLPVRVAERAHVVDQGVEPDVGDVLVVEGQRDPPREAGARPGDAEVLQRLAQEGQRLVPVPLRPDEVRVLLDVADQPVLVLAHAEEVVLLLHEVQGGVWWSGHFPSTASFSV